MPLKEASQNLIVFDWCPQMGDRLNVVEVGNCRKVSWFEPQRKLRERIPSNHRGFFFSMHRVWKHILILYHFEHAQE